MPADQETHALPSPWREFLSELDDMLPQPVELHCIGGFVLTLFYGLPRTTGDIDYYTAIPADLDLDTMAGQGSALHQKHKVWLHRVGVANLPEDYASRLSGMAPGQFRRLRILVPDAYDCILSELERASPKDRDDADYLFRSQKLDARCCATGTRSSFATFSSERSNGTTRRLSFGSTSSRHRGNVVLGSEGTDCGWVVENNPRYPAGRACVGACIQPPHESGALQAQQGQGKVLLFSRIASYSKFSQIMLGLIWEDTGVPNREVHVRVGAVAGAAYAGYRAWNQPRPFVVVEASGGFIGGIVGGLLPDWIDRPDSPHHRAEAHSMSITGTVGYFLNQQLPAWQASLREKAHYYGELRSTNPAPLLQFAYGILELLFLALSRFLAGVLAGYASHWPWARSPLVRFQSSLKEELCLLNKLSWAAEFGTHGKLVR